MKRYRLLPLVAVVAAGCAGSDEISSTPARQALIEDAAHQNADNFTFLPAISWPSSELRAALHLDDPAYFASDANPTVSIDEYLLDTSSGALSGQRPIGTYTTLDGVTTGADDYLFSDSTISEHDFFFRLKVDLAQQDAALGLKLFPYVYRMSVTVDGKVVGLADIVLEQIEVVDGHKRYHLRLKDLKQQLSADDYVVLDDGMNLDVRFWMNRCAGQMLAAEDACHLAATCDPLTGVVTQPNKPDGTSCDDGDACTLADACVAGACGGTPEVLAGEDACHVAATCDPLTGAITQANKPDGTACDDGNGCTLADACTAGTCLGTPVMLAGEDACHVAASCDPLTGIITQPNKPDGTACDDGNGCTLTDVCAAGTCAGTPEALPAEVPQTLAVPAMAYDEQSIVLVWHKPTDYGRIVDYRVYMNGAPLGSADANNTAVSPAKQYIDNFYARDVNHFHVKVAMHNFTAAGLSPSTAYSFTVRSVLADGCESADSNTVVQSTAAVPPLVDVTSYGAVWGSSTQAVVQGNTAAIQAAINACPPGGKVVVPGGAGQRRTFVTGAIFLKSNMTLEIGADATLQAAPVGGYLTPSSDENFPLAKGFYPNPQYLVTFADCQAAGRSDCVCADGGTDGNPSCLVNAVGYVSFRRPPSLINALDQDSHAPGTFENIRIVGKGAIDPATRIDHRGWIDGNGWIFKTTPSIVDEVGNTLPQYAAGSSSTVSTLGILAKDQVARSTAVGTHQLSLSNAYGQRRSSLISVRGGRNIYYSGFRALNPAFHGIVNSESENVVVNGVVNTTYDTNNGDGVEFANGDGAMVLNSFWDTGDDCVNFGAGQGALAATQAPMQNIWVFDNYFREGHGAVVAGSNTGGWIQDALVEDNVMYLTDDGMRMKSVPQTGGGARRWLFRDNAMKDITNADSTSGTGGNEHGPFTFILNYSQNTNATVPATVPARFMDITVHHVTVDGGKKMTPFGSNAPDGGPDRSEGPIHLQGYDPSNPTQPDVNGYGHVYHQNLVFDDVVMVGMAPVRIIDHLQDGVFNNMPPWTAAPTAPWILAATHPAQCPVPPPATLPLSSGCVYATPNVTYSGSTVPPQ
jgi:exo-poly-alpha-galacturonosidase